MATMKNSLDVPQETKNTTTVWPSNFTPEYIYKGNEDTNLKMYAHNVHSSIIYSSLDREAT